MVLRYGMDEKLGHVTYTRDRQPMLRTLPQTWNAPEYSESPPRVHVHWHLLNETFFYRQISRKVGTRMRGHT
jgi:hypothetical protein